MLARMVLVSNASGLDGCLPDNGSIRLVLQLALVYFETHEKVGTPRNL
jgi:hypothetical protein